MSTSSSPSCRCWARRLLSSLTALVTVGCGAILIAAPPAHAATYIPPASRTGINLDAGWKFVRSDVSGAQNTTFDDAAWQSVNVPHSWNAVDGADGGDNYYRGVGWYRRHYTVPAAFAGKMLYLQFAGANQVSDVWVNGVHQGQHIGGYARFRFGVKTAFKVGQDNVIAVKVNNAAAADYGPQRADYTFQGGIYRDVMLWAVDRLQIQMLDSAGPGVYLRQRAVSAAAATIDVTTKLFNNDAVARAVATRVVITDQVGAVVADASAPSRSVPANTAAQVVQTITIANPHRWDGVADPYRYAAHVELRDAVGGTVTDVVTEPLGLRTYSVDANSGFQLNGRPYHLHGVNLHQDFGGVGWAETAAQHQRDWDLITEIGATTARLAHYQHDQTDYDLADARGVVVWAEIPNIDFTTDSAAYTTNTVTSLRELIRQNYNHPSIVFWGIGNEQRSNDTKTNNLLTTLAGTADTEDPDRLTTYASAAVADTSTVNGHTEANGYNKYYGWYDGTYNDLAGWADGLHAAAPAKKVSLSEYGAGANINQHFLNPARSDVTSSFHPEEYQSLLHETSWRTLSARPYVWGTYVWNMFDFASDARAEGGQRGINDKGLVTRDRVTRKDSFYWYRANWSAAPTLYITSRRWTTRTVAATQLKVYSNASIVSATLNGTALGLRVSGERVFSWTGLNLRKGANTVTVTATVNGQTLTDTVTWTLT